MCGAFANRGRPRPRFAGAAGGAGVPCSSGARGFVVAVFARAPFTRTLAALTLLSLDFAPFALGRPGD